MIFSGIIFGAYPYPYVARDPDSIYIFSSLSLLANHTVKHNDHPGLILQVVGTLPVILGTAFIIFKGLLTPENTLVQKLIAQKEAGVEPLHIFRDTLTQNVIENVPFFQQLFLALVVLIYVAVLTILLWTLYRQNKQKCSFALVISGIALMMPPTLGMAIGINADFLAFSFGILFAASLLWKRNLRNDVLTALFFNLAAYTKITFAPLGLLMLTVDGKSARRLLKGTFAWTVLIYLLFWDFGRFLDFVGFMVVPAISNKPGNLDIAAVSGFYSDLFVQHPVQTFYLLLFVLFGILPVLKRGFRITAIVGLTVVMLVVGVTVLRQYKAEVYMWPVYAAGLLLTVNMFKAYPSCVRVVGIVFVVLIIICTGILYKDVTNLREERIARLEYRREYEQTVKQASGDTLLESEIGSLSLGNSYCLANAYAGGKYSSCLEEYFKKRFGLQNLYSLQKQKDGKLTVKQYFSGSDSKELKWLPSGGCYLAIQKGEESSFRQKFSQLDIRLVKTIELCNEPAVNVWDVQYKIK